MDERENRLPAWAKSLLTDLRRRLNLANEPLVRELAVLRPQAAKLKAENDALKELLQAAARGRHLAASEIVEVIESYAPWGDRPE